jgi:hypothetical protein
LLFPSIVALDLSTALISVPSAHSGHIPYTGQPNVTDQVCHISSFNADAPPGNLIYNIFILIYIMLHPKIIIHMHHMLNVNLHHLY